MLREKGLVLAQLTPESYASKGIELVLAPGVVPLPGVGTTLAGFPTISLKLPRNFLEKQREFPKWNLYSSSPDAKGGPPI